MQPRPASAIPTPEWYAHATELLDGNRAVQDIEQRMQRRSKGLRPLGALVREVLRKLKP